MTKESNPTTAIILAAGKGTRMQSDMPKVLHKVARKPMLGHVMAAASAAGCSPLLVVTAPDMKEVADYAKTQDETCQIAIQREQLGTGHAVLAAQEIAAKNDHNLLILFGDSPLVLPETLERLQREISKNPKVGVAVLGFETPPNNAYGRLVINDTNELDAIVEVRDATPEQKQIRWCNSGVMAIRGGVGWEMLERISNENHQGEFYLTDIIAIARSMGFVCRMVEGSSAEAIGVNSRADQAAAEAAMQQRLRAKAMAQGVSMIAPETVFLCADTEFGYDVSIEPNVIIGEQVVIGDGVEIRAFSHIEGAVIGDYSMVGPFARIRPGTNIGVDCKIGNFVELKKAEIEHGAKISHLSYIGDAHVGENANIGAGTITCNYDGYKKYHTEIGRDVFIGSNSALVAPVVVGDGAYVGAGSVVTQDVSANSLAVARSRQSQKDEWATDFRKRMEGDDDEMVG